MSGPSLFDVLRYSLASMVKGRWLLATLGVYLLVGLASAVRVADYAAASGLATNIYDVLFLTFSGPSRHSENPLDGLTWLLPHLLLTFWLGDAASRELHARGVYLLPKIGSRALWWSSKMLTFAAAGTVYFLVGIATVWLVGEVLVRGGTGWSELMRSGQLWPMPAGWSTVQFLSVAWLLFVSTAAAVVAWQNLLAVMLRNSLYAFAIASAVWIISWMGAGAGAETLRWLPGNQSMLVRHSVFDPEVVGFSLLWSLMYNAVLFVSAWWIGRGIVQRLDITGKTEEGMA